MVRRRLARPAPLEHDNFTSSPARKLHPGLKEDKGAGDVPRKGIMRQPPIIISACRRRVLRPA